MNQTEQAGYLIAESVLTDAIVREEWNAELQSALEVECDPRCDPVEDGGEIRYWGGKPGSTWVVALILPSDRTGD